jgi:site-specific DNA-cytosine methylase
VVSRDERPIIIRCFRDCFEFPIARTHQFGVIGNAVPPLVSEAVENPALN